MGQANEVHDWIFLTTPFCLLERQCARNGALSFVDGRLCREAFAFEIPEVIEQGEVFISSVVIMREFSIDNTQMLGFEV